jgi:4-amino-4-deoxy-L-arabinose transferase-like glycosyltransferase
VLLLLGSAALFVWNLSASGWANPYYSAAVLAGSRDWAAMLFGSFDAGNAITVDKTPAALWVMSLSARIFGFSSWSILVPQAIEGVAAVWLLYLAVRRRGGALGGLIAGAVLALTPVAALIFRFNNPDALLTLLLVASAYATLRALETASTRWLVLAGVAVGFAFLAKMLQGFVIIPVLAGVYLLAAPTGWWRRVRQVGAAALAVIVSAGWWVALLMLLPASSRPFIGGSQTNSVIDLMLGYNGLGRLTGDEVGRVGGGAPAFGGGGGPFSDGAGWLRLFAGELGSNVSWLLPAALVSFAALLWMTRRRRRTDPLRAQALLWGGWLLLTGLIFSLMEGIFHPYYTVVLVPAIGALVGLGVTAAWARRRHPMARAGLAAAVALTVIWAAVLLGRSPEWNPWLVPVLLFGGGLAAVGLLFSRRAGRRIQHAALAVSVAVMMLAPALGAVATAAEAHSGAVPATEPRVENIDGIGRFGPGVPGNAFRGSRSRPFQPGNRPFRAFGGLPNGGLPNGGFPDGGPPRITAPAFRGGAGAPANTGQTLGGLLDAATPNAALVTALQQDATQYRWTAATTGANNAAGLALGSGQSVMAIGGFNGTDPSPTLAEFQAYVAAGEIHYYVAGIDAGGFRGARGGSDIAAQISQWVIDRFDATTLGGVTVYDLAP